MNQNLMNVLNVPILYDLTLIIRNKYSLIRLNEKIYTNLLFYYYQDTRPKLVTINYEILQKKFGTLAQKVYNFQNYAQKYSFDEAKSVDCLDLLLSSIGFYPKHIISETEINYGTITLNVPKIDYIIVNLATAVSVTRAFRYRGEFNLSYAFLLLYKKIYSMRYAVLKFNECWSCPVNRKYWSYPLTKINKQIIFIWCKSVRDANLLEYAFEQINTDLNVLVICAVCNDNELFNSH